jgi:hypothetical protein
LFLIVISAELITDGRRSTSRGFAVNRHVNSS